jgi:hypothetical protein
MDDIAHRFAYHAPDTDQRVHAHTELRAACRHLAYTIDDLCPEGREKSLAMTKVEEAMFWANAAVARQL